MAKRSSGMLRKIDSFAPANLPLGRAVLWTAGLGLSAGIGRTLAELIPGDKIIPAQYEEAVFSILVAVLIRMKAVEKRIGSAASSIVAVTSMVNAVEASMVAVTGKSLRNTVHAYVAQLGTYLSGLVSSKPASTGGKGLSGASTVVAPREQLYGLGAAPRPRLTRLERKLASISAWAASTLRRNPPNTSSSQLASKPAR